MKKRKVLFIMQELKGGGAEKVLTDILAQFDYNRYDVTLLLIERVGVYLQNIPKDVKIISLFKAGYKLPSFTNSRYLRKSVRKFLLLLNLKFHKYDTIISFMEGESLFYHSLITSKAKRNISWVHIDLYKNHWSRKYFWDKDEEHKAYLKMDNIVCVSRQAQDALNKLFPNLSGVKTIYNLIDPEDINRKATEVTGMTRPDGFLISGCGRLTEQKRFDRFIDAILEVRNQGHNVHAWILGDGSLKPDLEKRVTTPGIIEFLGFRKNPMPFIKDSDVFMLSSDSEGFSLVVAEALALGKPVISTKCTGPTELLDDNAGILTDFTVKSMADAIESLIINPDRLKQYETSATHRAQKFKPQDILDQIYKTIDG